MIKHMVIADTAQPNSRDVLPAQQLEIPQLDVGMAELISTPALWAKGYNRLAQPALLLYSLTDNVSCLQISFVKHCYTSGASTLIFAFLDYSLILCV